MGTSCGAWGQGRMDFPIRHLRGEIPIKPAAAAASRKAASCLRNFSPLQPRPYRREEAIATLEERRKRPALALAADPRKTGQRHPQVGERPATARNRAVRVQDMESPQDNFATQAWGDLGVR